MTLKKLLTVDPSLTCSGWALFKIQDGSLLGVGNLKSLNAKVPLAKRLTELQESIDSCFSTIKLATNDVLICEEATSMLDPSASAKLERVRGIFETLARARKVLVPGRIHPRTVQSELLGFKGKQLNRAIVKSSAIDIVSKLYAKQLERIGFDISYRNLSRNQDIVDALLLGMLALTRIKTARQAELGLIDLLDKGSRRAGRSRGVWVG